MAFIELSIYSENLGMQTSVSVVIPQKSTSGEIGVDRAQREGKIKCLYLLHGLSDDHTIWMRRTSIERYADKYGICVVMPCGGTSFYTDMKYGKKYYTYVARELPRLICQIFNVSDRREDTYIAGLSMGGYGALKIGMRECDRFCMAAGLSSVADIQAVKEDFAYALVPVFGEEINIPKEEDLLWLAGETAGNPLRPRIYMGVGTEDFLYRDNQRLKEKLEKCQYDFTYREGPGMHSWDFWDEYIQYVLEWMLS